MQVHAGWLLLAAMLGGVAGMLVTSLCVISKDKTERAA